jgi:hypothetical protein
MALDPGTFDLREAFVRQREQMLAELSAGSYLRHSTAIGNSAEQIWLEAFERILPGRYRVTPAFVVDSEGNRSRQIDVVIYDGLHGMALFPHSSGLHLPVESVCAVFEVKSEMGRNDLADAGVKAASVLSLHSKRPPMTGVVASTSAWSLETFREQLGVALEDPDLQVLELGCLLRQGAFEQEQGVMHLSSPEESLAFFMIRLLERLRARGPAEEVDLRDYGRGIQSLERRRR